MRFYHLRIDHNHPEMTNVHGGFIVRANNEQSARVLVDQSAAATKGIWIDQQRSICEELSDSDHETIIIGFAGYSE